MSCGKAFVLFSFLTYWASLINSDKIDQIDVNIDSNLVFKGKDKTLFGYSLTLHTGQYFGDKPSIFVGAPKGDGLSKGAGSLHQCVIESKTCNTEKLDNPTVNLDYDIRENQWLGATVTSNGFGPIVVCAPRYSEKDSAAKDFYYMIGKCFRYETPRHLYELYPCTRQRSGYDQLSRHEHGFCQAGFSAAFKENSKSTLMGAVMGFDQRGMAVQQQSGDAGTKQFSITNNGDFRGFYLGYSVTYGNFFKLSRSEEAVAAGAPRIDISGRVYLYSADATLTSHGSLAPPEEDKLKRQHMYFGASVCGVDVNKDGYADLIVGAPFFSENGDEGRAYVFLSTKDKSGPRSLKLSSNTGLRGSNNKGARFGWSIAKAGDLNNDDIEDFIIGAPQDQPDLDNDGFGNGAIYIYYGREDGKFRDYQQRITAETVRKFYPNFRQFGYAIAGNVDTNGDQYPDIAIGAWDSDRVMLLRTRPIINVMATLTLSKKQIPVDNFTADCPNDPNKQCLDAEVCFSYLGKSVTGNHTIRYTFDLDEELVVKRVYLYDGKKVYQRKGSLTLYGKNVTVCRNFSEIRVEGKNRLSDALSRGKTDIVFKVSYELVPPDICQTKRLCPVLPEEKPSVSEKATLVLNCSDNTCDYDLNVKISSPTENITIGETENIKIRIELKNQDEVVYNPEIFITHHSSLQYEKKNVLTTGVRVEEREVANNNDISINTEKFIPIGPLNKNDKVVFELQYSTKTVSGDEPKLSIDVKAKGITGKEKNEKDNNDTITFTVKRNVNMVIKGNSVPKLVNYPKTAPSLNIIKGNDYSAVNVSNVGPSVKVNFELTNEGKSDLELINFVITYPVKKYDAKENEYIVYPISIREEGGQCTDKKSHENPLGLKLPSSNRPTSDEVSGRQKRAVVNLKPRTSTSSSIECNITNLGVGKRFTVAFEIRLWSRTLVEYYSNDLVVEILASASYEDRLTIPARTVNELGEVEIQVSPENVPGKSKSTPVWIIIVAVLGGVLLLALAILALFKLGFFKRNRPPQDISSPQTDEVPVVAT
ncbi:integrin alpha-PS2-like [Dendronephthya gigantea]|uniref:integrin alpha-PS2-like n=1 Tax=Dendronephthya gigantea TaxID=151771 RepID=UPI00106A8745|nr:integrin alpha-PS2-like [Dendronephthya gigantea]